MRIDMPPAQITDDFWMLGSHEYPVYLALGQDEAALFEGGTGPMGPLVREQMESLAVRPEWVRRIVLAHAHPDHVMGVPEFRAAMPQARVQASEIAARTLAVEKVVAYFRQIDEADRKSVV